MVLAKTKKMIVCVGIRTKLFFKRRRETDKSVQMLLMLNCSKVNDKSHLISLRRTKY